MNGPQTASSVTMERPAPLAKDKIGSIMEAASALAALCSDDKQRRPSSQKVVATTADAENGDNDRQSAEKMDGEADTIKETVDKSAASDSSTANSPKFINRDATELRHLPQHKKPNAALTFPEKLMNMMSYADRNKNDPEYSIAWLQDGKAFIVRKPEMFTKEVLPLFFKQAKFSSFTRKLYRWGFRQVSRGNQACATDGGNIVDSNNGESLKPDQEPIVFGNEYFQRDERHLMAKMKSVTASNSSRALTNSAPASSPSSSEINLGISRKICAADVSGSVQRYDMKRMLPAGSTDVRKNIAEEDGNFSARHTKMRRTMEGPVTNGARPMGLCPDAYISHRRMMENENITALNVLLEKERLLSHRRSGVQFSATTGTNAGNLAWIHQTRPLRHPLSPSGLRTSAEDAAMRRTLCASDNHLFFNSLNTKAPLMPLPSDRQSRVPSSEKLMIGRQVPGMTLPSMDNHQFHHPLSRADFISAAYRSSRF